MIHVLKTKLKNRVVHLASSSPRRKEVLTNVGLDFIVTPSDFEENLDKSLFSHASEYVLENSKQKALDVSARLLNCEANAASDVNVVPKDYLIIGCDTVVVLDDAILEKPHTHANALAMLSRLNNRTHSVYSGVTLVGCGGKTHQFYEKTDVTFGDNPKEAIQVYADSDEPLDKAGAYGIQGVGATLVTKINGCYSNVVGFPIDRFCRETYDWLE